ncbi:uncharacterized protein Z518_03660 [Rhinocladiella mackenziei CBS 650.93]|uniref:Rhinocladiella mackenziei CBS 650.93 unplaced genomic scaffold supercont1.3, whole genome shotgun sequence n=1 Tax=Rhinocladiella mackenziei CBS 650.93 TaxID=1442369 RepID=A0A0D2H5J9_9EURO|nr:uncharacterized protein Z518_03660 [Rhinocladiella mackenziei CBS 650.93]KIX05688.1 hypothetical protein Z518_03660 [Rhinocladiella mackenziei CBS 650.93]
MARYSAHTYHDAEQSSAESGGESGECNGSQKDQCSDNEGAPIRTSDREELIQCIKRGQRPTWVPKPGLEALCAEVNAEQNGTSSRLQQSAEEGQPATTADVRPPRDKSPSPHTLSAADVLHRSLSALHTGDFYENATQLPTTPSISTRPGVQPQYGHSPPIWDREAPTIPHFTSPFGSPSEILRRSRAPSLGSGLSSSFVMRVPTSPLVHATNNPSLDFSPKDTQPSEIGKSTRRRTMPPNAFESLNMSPIDNNVPNFSRPLPYPHSQHEGDSFPPMHRPRRSLSSFTYQAAASPQTPFSARSRRPSLASDVSPRQRASMVGSFEESILRGRMSAPASKPLDFVAQIGVLGKGNCSASLKCPAHVTVPFPAVFYNYPSSNELRSISDDNPSPYVGTIDLEHNLKPPEPPSRRHRPSPASLDPEALAAEITSPENTAIGRALAREAPERKGKVSTSPKVPPGGAYRIPQKGQLQIIIKNPNKTAVKLFLVPYDLEGMLPGTKTFVRQRSFSSGPILENVLSEKQAGLAIRDALNDKDILRYLIHLKFCCTAKSRFYLYDNIRVVFANRVPDDKEKLRNEVQLPEPRFSPYKPPNDSGSRSPSVADEKFSPRPNIPRQKQEPATELEQTVSPIPGFLPSTSSRSSPVSWPSSNGPSIVRCFSPTSVEAGDGLISRQLRELSGTGSRNDG